MWKEFLVLGYRVVAKVYDTGSSFGIQGAARISKISIRKGPTEFLNYDRGMDFNNLPDGALDKILDALNYII